MKLYGLPAVGLVPTKANHPSMSSTTSTDVVFKLADSRGIGTAKDLLGEDFQGVGITDRYKGYKNLFN